MNLRSLDIAASVREQINLKHPLVRHLINVATARMVLDTLARRLDECV